MKLRTLILTAGALLTTGGTIGLGESHAADFRPHESVYMEEESYPNRDRDEFRMHEDLTEDESYFMKERARNHHREMERYHSEWDNFTQDELDSWRGRRNQTEENYNTRDFRRFGGMKSRRDVRFGHGCGGFRR